MISDLAKKHNYSERLVDFIRKFFVITIPNIVTEYSFDNFYDELDDNEPFLNSVFRSGIDEQSIIKILLGIYIELTRDIFGESNFIYSGEEKQEKEALEKLHQSNPIEYYKQLGTPVYVEHCNKDGSFRYSDFIMK